MVVVVKDERGGDIGIIGQTSSLMTRVLSDEFLDKEARDD